MNRFIGFFFVETLVWDSFCFIFDVLKIQSPFVKWIISHLFKKLDFFTSGETKTNRKFTCFSIFLFFYFYKQCFGNYFEWPGLNWFLVFTHLSKCLDFILVMNLSFMNKTNQIVLFSQSFVLKETSQVTTWSSEDVFLHSSWSTWSHLEWNLRLVWVRQIPGQQHWSLHHSLHSKVLGKHWRRNLRWLSFCWLAKWMTWLHERRTLVVKSFWTFLYISSVSFLFTASLSLKGSWRRKPAPNHVLICSTGAPLNPQPSGYLYI